MKENDLPLFGNVEQILIISYGISLAFFLEEKVFRGWVKLDLKSRAASESDTVFELVLDACDLNILAVFEGIDIVEKSCPCMIEKVWNSTEYNALKFSVSTWYIKIWKENIFSSKDFPSKITIFYETKSSGASLDWVLAQDSRICCYTYGAWINNRSLIPCHDSPEAMASWSASICINDSSYIAVMSSPEELEEPCETGRTRFVMESGMTLPISTLALAVGPWRCKDIVLDSLSPFTSLFACEGLLEKTSEILQIHLNRFMKIYANFMVDYPFKRIKILIPPRSFDGLGMANPNLIYLSQTIFSVQEGSPMVSRIAHELAHSWFGLMIGPKDWTEEWLSEGFATFLEEIVTYLSDEDKLHRADRTAIRDYLRLNLLKNECINIDQNLQILRPNNGKESVKFTYEDGSCSKLVKNGLNSFKRTIQVHYLKGYFLLKHLSDSVGNEKFVVFLKFFYDKNKEKLISSIEFLESFVEYFPSTGKTCMKAKNIASLWLDRPGLPPVKFNFKLKTNEIYRFATKAFQLVKRHSNVTSRRVRKRSRSKLSDILPDLEDLSLQVFLNKSLSIKYISKDCLRQLQSKYSLNQRNADVRHLWYELVVKHNFEDEYEQVRKFLINEQAMGVYLYGELLFNSCLTQRSLALEVFAEIKNEMNRNFKSIVEGMINDGSTTEG